MRFEPPDEEAYGRVTNPERYGVVVDAAHVLIDRLQSTFDVTLSHGIAAEDFPTWQDPSAETVRITPSTGSPLRFLITDFPGVVVRFGFWGREAFPTCGCDACAEQPGDVIERMQDVVEAVIAGRYIEELTRRHLRTEFSGGEHSKSSNLEVSPKNLQPPGPQGRHEWPPWPRRADGTG